VESCGGVCLSRVIMIHPFEKMKMDYESGKKKQVESIVFIFPLILCFPSHNMSVQQKPIHPNHEEHHLREQQQSKPGYS
jgi:hypothetical protein